MSNEDKPTLVVSIARMISSAFLAMVIVGPSPYGYLMWAFRIDSFLVSLLLIILYCVLCGVVAGILAGRALAWKAAVLCVVWGNHGLLLEPLADLRQASSHDMWSNPMPVIAIALGFLAVFAAISGVSARFASKRLGIERLSRYSSAWIAVSLVGLSLFVYAYAQGMETAVRVLRPEVEGVTSKVYGPRPKTNVAGIFPTVEVSPCPTGPGEDGYDFCLYWFYTDPTGHVLIGRLRTLAD